MSDFIDTNNKKIYIIRIACMFFCTNIHTLFQSNFGAGEYNLGNKH